MKKMNNKNFLYFILLILLSIVTILMILMAKSDYMFTVSDSYQNADQAYHIFLGEGLHLKSNGELIEPEQSSGYPIIISLFFHIFGISDNTVTFVSIFFGIILIFLTFLIGNEIFGAKEGLISSMILIFSPLFLWTILASQNDMTGTSISVLSIFLIIKFAKTLKYKYLLSSGFALYISFLTKYPHILIGLLIIAVLIYVRKKIDIKKCLISLSIPFILIIIPFMIYNFADHGSVLPFQYYFYKTQGSYFRNSIEYVFTDFMTLITYIFSNYGYVDGKLNSMFYTQIFSLIFLLGTIFLIKDKNHIKSLFIIWFSSYIIYFFTFNVVSIRYYLPLLVPISIIISHGVISTSSMIEKMINFKIIKNKNLLTISMILILVIPTIFYIPNAINLIHTRSEWSYIKDAGIFIKDNTPSNSIVISPNSYALEFYSRRDVIESNTNISKIYYIKGGKSTNISELAKRYPIYILQVNNGYQDWQSQEVIQTTKQTLDNISDIYKIKWIRNMPQYILFKIDL